MGIHAARAKFWLLSFLLALVALVPGLGARGRR